MAVQISPAPKTKTRMTYERYRALPEDGKRYKVIGGELIMTATPLIDHQCISGNLQFILETWIRANASGELFNAPVEVYLSKEDFVEPDLIFISRERQKSIAEKNIEGPPDLVVEILSPGTARYDRVMKMKTYARYKVAHYWMVDPAARTLEAFELEKDTYRLAATHTEDKFFQPTFFPKLTISLTELWK